MVALLTGTAYRRIAQERIDHICCRVVRGAKVVELSSQVLDAVATDCPTLTPPSRHLQIRVTPHFAWAGWHWQLADAYPRLVVLELAKAVVYPQVSSSRVDFVVLAVLVCASQ
eukprot:376174-Rhodomonas_salina.2